MTRRSISFRELAERKYPWRVDLEVPNGGLGLRLDAMHDWCRERKVDWAQHGYLDGLHDVVRFYFMDKADAAAFQSIWGADMVNE